MKSIKYFLGLTTLVVILTFTFGVSAFASVKISSKNFPDNEIRETIKKYDTNKNGYLSDSENKKITAIKISNSYKAMNLENYYKIDSEEYKQKNLEYSNVDCTGLDLLTNLKSLKLYPYYGYDADGHGYCKINNAKVINKLTKLETLKISADGINTTFNLNNLKNLKVLRLDSCLITKIDLTKNTNLETLIFTGQNLIKNLNLKKNKKLKKVDFWASKSLENVYFSKSNKIERLTLNLTSIKNFNINNLNKKSLVSLKLATKTIKKVNVKGFKNLKFLSVWPKTIVKGLNKKNTEFHYTRAR